MINLSKVNQLLGKSQKLSLVTLIVGNMFWNIDVQSWNSRSSDGKLFITKKKNSIEKHENKKTESKKNFGYKKHNIKTKT